MRDSRGASTLMVAGTMLLLLGVAAVTIDLGLVFNERNQDQNAADNAVMAGALDKAEGDDPQQVAARTLFIARENLRDIYGAAANAPEWVELWRTCNDPGNTGWAPLPEPAGWAAVATPSNPAPTGTETLDCISETTALLRVRIPDQLVEAEFGRVFGVDTLATQAVAVAKLDWDPAVPPVVPFGLSGTSTPGELCFGSAPTGGAIPPCTGSSAGTFGTILSELFGQFYGTVNCGNPTATNSVAINVALGIDHRVVEWEDPDNVLGGVTTNAHPGDVFVLNTLNETNRDACDNVGGIAIDVDGPPINTLLVDTGFSGPDIESGLVSNATFFGRPSRLQQGSNPTRTIVQRRTGANEELWELDNRGPWMYLLPGAGAVHSDCAPAAYPTQPTDVKIQMFNNCINNHDGMTQILHQDIATSPRFVWAPMYWYDFPASGLSWEPIYDFKPSFVGGVWLCQGGTCNIPPFYPDEEQTGDVCDPAGGSNCHAIQLRQMSAWYLPESALPPNIADPGPLTPLSPSLWQ